MNERLKQIRKESKMTQDEFAQKLGLAKNYIYLMESGRTAITDRVVKDVCREFEIDEAWLRTGAGEMHAPKNKQNEMAYIISQLFKKSQADEQTYNFIVQLSEILIDMNESQMKLVFDAIRKLNAAISEPEEKKE